MNTLLRAAAAAAVALLLLPAPNAGAFPNEPDGFRGLPWGSPPERAKDLRLATDSSALNLRVYDRDGDSLRVGAAQAARIGYMFLGRRFAAAFVFVSGTEQFGLLRAALEARYGRGVPSDAPGMPLPAPPIGPLLDGLMWYGDRAFAILNYDPGAEHGYAMIASRKVFEDSMAEWFAKNAGPPAAALDNTAEGF